MKKKTKQKRINTEQNRPISKRQKLVFVIITLFLPIILFLLFEPILRLVNYGGDLRLFIPSTAGYENYLRCNPNVARRYFYVQNTIPQPPKDLFLAKKPDNVFRIFVMGGSTTAGFPYGNNMMFSRILGRSLEHIYPDKRFEIINVSLSAINSYTLLDFIDEVLEHYPDLILIYAGHNEYYGALGVGSVESLGNQRWLIKSYLALQKFRFFLVLKDILAKFKTWISAIKNDGSIVDPSATLMARIVAEQTIPFKSDLYESGKIQFKSNLSEILKKIKGQKVPVILSELVSNIRDQQPFISVGSGAEESAIEKYREAILLERAGGFNEAKQSYYLAKDLDALRFRAPEEFNSIINQLGAEYEFTVVPMKSYFEKHSPNGLIGNSLIIEHLHPNSQGYYLMANAFLETIINNKLIDTLNIKLDKPDFQTFITKWGFTDLDKDFAKLTINSLKSGWPFKPKATPNKYIQTFQPNTITEKIAFKVISNPDFGIEMGHLELAEYYEKHRDFRKAFEEYKALIFMIPYESEFYEKAATVLLKIKEYDTVEKVLHQSLKFKESFFAFKWLGQIALMNKDYTRAILFLEKGKNIEPNDAQLLFNLARSYYFAGNKIFGDEILEILKRIEPTSIYTQNLQAIKNKIENEN